MRTLGLIAAAFVLTALPALANPPECRWSRSWEAALAEAKARNVPIHVTFHEDNSPACASMESSVYVTKDFVAASRRWVNVYCSNGSAHGVVKVGGEERCKIHPSLKCADHISCELNAGGKYFEGAIDAPSTVWCMPDGKEIGREQGGMTARQLIDKMAEAEKAVGPGLDSDSYEFLVEKLATGDTAANEHRAKDAVEAYEAAIKAMAKNPLAKKWVDLAQVGLDHQVELGKSLIEDAIQERHGGYFAKAKELLTKVQTDFKGHPVAKEAEKEMAAVLVDEKAWLDTHKSRK